jgi:hypothetical protein
MRYAYCLFMTNTNRMQLLTNRNGRKTRAFVTYHAQNFAAGTTVCGITWAALDAQDLRIDQGTVCGSNSDVNCAACIKAGAFQIVRAGVPCGHSKRSSAKLYQVKRGGVVVGTITELYPDLVIVRLDSRPCADQTFDSYMAAWRATMPQPA